MKADHWRQRLSSGLTLALVGASLMVACSPAEGVPTAVEKILAERCAGCHIESKAMSWRAPSRAEAERILDDMERRGATFTPEERATLIDYYVR